MLDFEVQKFTRRCAATQRELQPGEPFFSVLVPEGHSVVRRDYAVQAWEGPPADAIGWWRAEVPDPRSTRLHWAPHEVMLHLFQQLQEDADQQDFAYVLALLMIRRRILKLEASEVDTEGREVLVVYCPRNESEYHVVAATPTAERANAIQRELAALLFAKADEQ